MSRNGAAAGYEPVYWGDLAAKFRWNLASRPKTQLIHMGGNASFAGLGALREATSQTPLDKTGDLVGSPGPVLGVAPTTDANGVGEPLSSVAVDKRGDFLADLYLACRPAEPGDDPIADDPDIAAIADAAASVAEKWDRIVSEETTDDARAQRLIAEVDANLFPSDLVGMGGAADWITDAGEMLRRAAVWPGDAVSTIFAETRPILNEFVAYFVGDVFTYLTNRGDEKDPGPIPSVVFPALRRAQARKKATGEPIVIVSHSMGGQLIYDALTYFADHDPTLYDVEIDHWITCGSQVSLFAEMRLFLGQIEAPPPAKLPKPARVKLWTNFFDPNDLVGFVMTPVFDDVSDIEYNTGYGLALAHTGYLARPSFFESVASLL